MSGGAGPTSSLSCRPTSSAPTQRLSPRRRRWRRPFNLVARQHERDPYGHYGGGASYARHSRESGCKREYTDRLDQPAALAGRPGESECAPISGRRKGSAWSRRFSSTKAPLPQSPARTPQDQRGGYPPTCRDTAYLMRMPVSLLPGPESQVGKGASVTVEAKFEPTTDLLPVTFRNVLILDTTYQLKDILTQACTDDRPHGACSPKCPSTLGGNGKPRQPAHPPKARRRQLS